MVHKISKNTNTDTFSTDLPFSFGWAPTFFVFRRRRRCLAASVAHKNPCMRCFRVFSSICIRFSLSIFAFLPIRNFFTSAYFVLVSLLIRSARHKTDNVDRRFGKRFNNRHWLYERAVIGFKASYGKINSKADTKKGTPQYHVHMPSTKHGRSNISLGKT